MHPRVPKFRATGWLFASRLPQGLASMLFDTTAHYSSALILSSFLRMDVCKNSWQALTSVDKTSFSFFGCPSSFCQIRLIYTIVTVTLIVFKCFLLISTLFFVPCLFTHCL
jgi:hypothetical protein